MRCKACNSIIEIVKENIVLIDSENRIYSTELEELCSVCIGQVYRHTDIQYLDDSVDVNEVSELDSDNMGDGNYMTQMSGNPDDY